MIVPGSANSLLLAQGAATGYNLTNSLRFRASASAYLNRTPSTTSGTQQYTISVWCKRGKLGSYQNILGSACPNPPFGNTNDGLRFNSSDQLEMLGRGGNDIYVVPSMVFRDPSAWYHIVVAVDTTQVTSSNRVKIYVNGSQVTSFSSATYPTLGYTMLGFNVSGYANSIGSDPTALGTSVFDSYMAEINVISGSQQAVTAFGENNATTGVWQPKAYTGTYGTNGYYLKFTDVATTSGSNAGLGKDFSGNGNYWNTNNISVTTGSTYDSMTDVPTLTSATTANYCVMNPLSSNGATFSNGNLTFALSSSTYPNMYSTMGMTSGKFYCEVTIGNSNDMVGVSLLYPINSTSSFYNQANGYGYWGGDGNKYNNASGTSYGASYTSGDVIGIAFDATNGSLTFYKNGTSQGVAYSSIPAGTYFFCQGIGNTSVSGSFNFGQQPFTYTPPTGYVALNTYNLPTSTIVAGNTVMDATTYTGTGATNNVANAGTFKPDLVWIKNRSSTNSHQLTDSVRGVNLALASDLTIAEYAGNMNAFNSGGFQVTSSSNAVNASGQTYVGWQWQAGQGTTSSNTNGSITSTVSVNATAGFSVVTYTGNGSSGATVGHGLGVAPQFIVTKDRNGVDNWNCYHSALGNTKAIYLNLNNAPGAASAYWNNTTPSSTVFTLGNSGGTNGSGVPVVAYCWAEIAGFSKFGSYTGNGSADGPFVYLGFRPKFVMVKLTTASDYWTIIDTTRNPYNSSVYRLYPNDSLAEDTLTTVDMLSNGFKVRSAGATSWNASGGTLIYAAFAENPFKNALAR